MSEGALVAGNVGPGIVGSNGASVLVDGGILLNRGPGIRLTGPGTSLSLKDETVCRVL